MQMKNGSIHEIVLTGGPCGGKSTLMTSCKQTFGQKGYKLISIPEAVSEVMASGIGYHEMPGYLFNDILFSKILNNEENSLRAGKYFAEQGQKVIIMYDRGLRDIAAYTSPENWNRMMKKHKLTDEILNNRYDAVLNLVTTAYGAEIAFEQQWGNNPQRHETGGIQQARDTEDRTQAAWQGHHNFQVFVNGSGGWPEKEKRVLDAIEATCASRN